MSEAKEESLYEALNKGDLSAFLSMVEAGARITPREENISRLFTAWRMSEIRRYCL